MQKSSQEHLLQVLCEEIPEGLEQSKSSRQGTTENRKSKGKSVEAAGWSSWVLVTADGFGVISSAQEGILRDARILEARGLFLSQECRAMNPSFDDDLSTAPTVASNGFLAYWMRSIA